MNNYDRHFKKELAIMESKLAPGDSLAIKDFIPHIEAILETFSKQGHSGMSAPMYANVLSRTIKDVLLFKPLSPITGDDSEWNDVGTTLNKGEPTDEYQNNRLSSLFKTGKNGRPYYLDAIVWQGEEEHDTFTGTVEGRTSRQYIRLPFIPKTFYVHVYKEYAEGTPEDTKEYYEEKTTEGNRYYKYRIKDHKELEEVFKYYDPYHVDRPINHERP